MSVISTEAWFNGSRFTKIFIPAPRDSVGNKPPENITIIMKIIIYNWLAPCSVGLIAEINNPILIPQNPIIIRTKKKLNREPKLYNPKNAVITNISVDWSNIIIEFAISLLTIISRFAVGVISILGKGASETIESDVKFIVVPTMIMGKISDKE